MMDRFRSAQSREVLVDTPAVAAIVPGSLGAADTNVFPPQRWLAGLFTTVLARTAHEIPPAALGKSAIIFSPHPDDECLGCGGTIIKKKEAGARLSIVHFTDGSGSHPHLIGKQELKAIRTQECKNAASRLGVDSVHFLDFEDSALNNYVQPAVERVVDILRNEQPDEVFVPHRCEPSRQAADHIAATEIVMTALRSYSRPVTIWEYPVWFWLHWPWVGLLQTGDPSIKTRHVARHSLRFCFGLRAFSELGSVVCISTVLDKKRAALLEHRSQMTQLNSDPNWITLAHVAKGQFLHCFQTDYEFFRRSVYPNART